MQEKLILAISPSTTLTNELKFKIEQKNLPIYVQQASQKDAIAVAHEYLQKGVQVIISRGNTGNLLRKHLDVPVIEVEHTFFDCINALETAQKICPARSIAFLATSESYYHILQRSKPFLDDCTIVKLFPRFNQEDIDACLVALHKEQIRVAIGGLSLKDVITSHGIRYVMSESDGSAIDKALEEAQYFLHIQQTLKEKQHEIKLNNCILDATVNAISEGVIAMDQKSNIIVFSNQAKKLLRAVKDNNAKERVPQEIKELLAHSITHKKGVYNQIITIEQRSFIISIRHMDIGKSTIGVATFQRQETVEKIERKIRFNATQKGHFATCHFTDIIGTSRPIKRVTQTAKKYAQTESTILLAGETGVGKEMFAESIHNESRRKRQPFVAINCAALAPSVLESELFGYARGAFTGALSEGKAGYFELAHQGTIFLDEISETPYEVQTKLLRVLQEKSLIRVGGDELIKIDVRIIVASNKDLEELVAEGKFREDLYYRIAVLELLIPPLRERADDIPLLAEAFSQSLATDTSAKGFSSNALQLLKSYPWRGNVRQLRNFTERMLVVTETNLIHSRDVLSIMNKSLSPATSSPQTNNNPAPPVAYSEKELIHRTLIHTKGSKKLAAEILNMSTVTLWRKIKKITAEDPDYLNQIYQLPFD